MLGKHRHAVHRQHIVDAYSSEKRTLARHVGSRDDIEVAVGNAEIVAHRFLPEEGMPQPLGLNVHTLVVTDLGAAGLGMVEAHRRHTHQGIATAHEVNPSGNLSQVALLPAQIAVGEADVAKGQRIAEEQSQKITAAVDGLHDAAQLAPTAFGLVELLPFPASLAHQPCQSHHGFHLANEAVQVIADSAQRLLRDKEGEEELRCSPKQGHRGLNIAQDGQHDGDGQRYREHANANLRQA